MKGIFRDLRWNLWLSVFIGFFIGELFRFFHSSSCSKSIVKEAKIPYGQLSDRRIQQEEKRSKKKIFIGIITTPEYLKTRGAAIKETWLKEIDDKEATLRFFSGAVQGFEGLTEKLLVDDYVYPPQEKSFRMLSYFGSLADEYDWFLRIDDDSVIQYDHLSQFLSMIDPTKHHLIGSPGFGRDADDFIPPGKFYCMGGPGIIFSSALVRDIKPYLPACSKQLYTNHEDIEICRCIWDKLDVYCTNSYEMNKLMHNNWKKNILPGEIGYPDNFRIPEDLSEDVIDHAITLHAAKKPENQREVRIELLKRKARKLSMHISKLKASWITNEFDVTLLNSILFRKIENWGTKWAKRYSEKSPYFIMRPPLNVLNALRTFKEWQKEAKDKNVYYGNNDHFFVVQAKDESSDSMNLFIHEMRNNTLMTEQRKLSKDSSLKRKNLTIITPISGRGDAFHRFIDQFKELSIKDGHLKLVVAVVDAELSNISRYMKFVLRREYEQKKIFAMSCQDLPFNRADCINRGISILDDDDDFFVCDVDLLLNEDFLKRLRLSITENSAVFPIFFSQFEINAGHDINENNGFWRLFSYGMVAMSKKSFQLTNGLNARLKGWGGEDVEFANECIDKKLNIFRAHDPSLFHNWHTKNCSATSNDQYQSCLATKMSNKMSLLSLVEKFSSF